MLVACNVKRGRAANRYGVPAYMRPLQVKTLRFNDRDNGLTRHNDHLYPTEFVVDSACVDLGQLDIIGHDIADFMQRLLIFAPCVDLPHRALVQRRASLWRPGDCVTHADTPHERRISMPSSLSRALVQTGSHTISIRTSSTPGSCSKRVRLSSMMYSIAGHPIAVKVSLRSTSPSCSLRSTIKPISTMLMGISGSVTSRSASHNAGHDVS